MSNTTTNELDRDTAIARIKAALKARSGKTWSVTGGKGTAWGWIEINSPPKRRGEFDYMSDSDRAELAKLLGLESVHCQGVSIAASLAHRREYVDRAEGRTPTVKGEQYWD